MLMPSLPWIQSPCFVSLLLPVSHHRDGLTRPVSLDVLRKFVEEECIPAEAVFENELKSSGKRWGVVPPVVEALKARAKYVVL